MIVSTPIVATLFGGDLGECRGSYGDVIGG